MQPYAAHLVAAVLGLRHWTEEHLANLLAYVVEPGLRDALTAGDPWTTGLETDTLVVVGVPGPALLDTLAGLLRDYRASRPAPWRAWFATVTLMLLCRCELVAELFLAPTRGVTLLVGGGGAEHLVDFHREETDRVLPHFLDVAGEHVTRTQHELRHLAFSHAGRAAQDECVRRCHADLCDLWRTGQLPPGPTT